MSEEGEGAETGEIETKADAEPDAWRRDQHEAHLRTINALSDQLKTGRQAQETTEARKAVREYLTIFLLLITVVLTALTFVVFYKQLGEMRKSTKAAHNDSAAQLNGANEAAKAALQVAHSDSAAALDATRNNFAADQRPWVLLSDPSGKGFSCGPGPSGNKIRWDYSLKNFGKTPAKDMSIFEYMAIGKGPFIQTNGGKPRHGNELAQGNHASSVVVTDTAIAPEDCSRIVLQEPVARAKVVVRYRDTYGVRYTAIVCVMAIKSGALMECGKKDEVLPPDVLKWERRKGSKDGNH